MTLDQIPARLRECLGTAAQASTLVLLLGCLGGTAARADAYLADWCFNVNGVNVTTASCNQFPTAPMAPNVNGSNFDFTLEPAANTLGSVVITLSPGSNQFALAYMDYDLNYPVSGSFQDFGSVNGTPPAGLSYELDDPNASNIFTDFAANALADTNNVATYGGPPTVCCDVSWSLGVGDINVPNGYQDLVTFTVSTTAPPAGFYLQQTNVTPVGGIGPSIYLYETQTLQQTGPVISEPASIALLGGSLIGLGLLRRRAHKVD